MNKVINLEVEKRYSRESEIFSRVHKLIHEYDGEVSLVSILGILELVKDSVKKDVEGNN